MEISEIIPSVIEIETILFRVLLSKRWYTLHMNILQKYLINYALFSTNFFLKHFLTRVLAYGIYDKEYQIKAKNWIIMKMSTILPSFNTKADTTVPIKLKIYTTDVKSLVLSVMFLNCLWGPTKKVVLKNYYTINL